jgi:transcriptional regulator with XRE-family HTH domain
MQEDLIIIDKQKADIKPYQQRLREGRLLAGWSLKAVAEALGKSLQYVSQFEQGRNEMTVAQFVAACEALSLRSEWVLEGIGPVFVRGAQARPTKKQGRPAKRTA